MSIMLPHKPLSLVTDAKQLRMKCARVRSAQVPSLIPILQQMYRLCAENDGAAIAAPQVGLPLSFFLAMSIEKDDLDFDVLFNPSWKPVLSAGKKDMIEGCLSFPGQRYLVSRWQKIKLSWHSYSEETGSFRRISIKVDGILAQTAQHEIDHLEGRLLPDIGKSAQPVFTSIELGELNGTIIEP